MKSRTFLSMLFLCLISCSSRRYEIVLSEMIESDFSSKLSTYEYVVVSPRSGCTGCIQESEYLFGNRVNKNDIFFIFTEIVSMKEMRLRLGKEKVNKPNVYLDTDNKYCLSSYKESAYPIAFKIENGKITSEVEIASLIE